MMNYNVVHPSLEITDPIPNIYELFQNFSYMFFENRLQSVTVDWSNTMKSAAGCCSYSPRDKFCQIQLSAPLLKLRSRKDLVETLLHEMIHAYLFVTENDTDRNGHGSNFKGIMKRINDKTGANITVYHNFYDEVNHYKTNWYRCNGPCQHVAPLFGFVKGKLDRGPCHKDRWYAKHKTSCGGIFHKSLVAPSKSLISKEMSSSKKLSKKSENNQTKLISNNGQLNLWKEKKENEVSSLINTKNIIQENDNNNVATTNTSVSFVPFSGVGKVLGHSSSFTEKSRTVDLKRKVPSYLNNKENVKIVDKDVESECSEPIKKKPLLGNNQKAIPFSIKDSSKEIEEQSDIEKAIEISIKSSYKHNEEQSDMEKAIQLSLTEFNQFSNKQNIIESNTFVECPSCPNVFLLSEINEHLNQCLS